jgi:tetratricopeptide (TPR) repeat protein
MRPRIVIWTWVGLLGLGLTLLSTTLHVHATHNVAALYVINVDQGSQINLAAAERAIHWAERTLAQQPQAGIQLSTRRLLARAYVQLQMLQDGLDVIGGKDGCADALACHQVGQILYDLGHKAEAIAVWQRLPDVDVYFAYRGDLAYAMDDKAIALQLYEVSWQISDVPTWSKTTMLLNLCREPRPANEINQRVYWCEQAATSRDDYWTKVELGRAYTESSQYQLAEKVLREAIQISSDPSGAYRFLGISLYRQGKVTEGLDMLYTSVRLAPGDVWARIELANYLSLDDQKLAAACEYVKAMQLTNRQTLLETLAQRIQALPITEDDLRECK